MEWVIFIIIFFIYKKKNWNFIVMVNETSNCGCRAKMGDNALDLCCGSGDLSFLLSEKVGTSGKVRNYSTLETSPFLFIYYIVQIFKMLLQSLKFR